MGDGGEVQAGRRPGPLAGLLAGAALGAVLFLAAVLVRERMVPRRGPWKPPEGFTAAGDARAAVRVLATPGREGVRALLLPLREDGAPAGPEEALLDAALFPGGPAHGWARLLVANPAGAPPLRLPLAPGAVVLEAPSGPLGNVDLASAFEARAGTLSAHRVLDLRVARVHDREVEVPPGGLVRVLVAFPRGADPSTAAGATLAGGIRLVPKETPAERLRAVLLDGRVEDLPAADRAEARGAAAPKDATR